MAADSVSLHKISQRLLQLPAEQRATFCRALSDKGLSVAALPIAPRASAGDLPDVPLAPAQQRLWFIDQFDESARATYNICSALHLRGPLDVAALRSAFEQLLRRHAALRSAIVGIDGRAVLREIASVALPWQMSDLRNAADRNVALQRIAEAMALTPFDLAQPPLMRVHLARIGEQEHQLWLTLHHIAADGWSMQVLVRELSHLYSAAGAPLPVQPITFADYASWHHEVLQPHGVFDDQLRYWRQHLGDDHPVLSLPTDRPRPPMASQRGARHAHRLPAVLNGELKTLCRQHGKTPFTLVLAAFQLLLWRLSGQPEVRIGTPVANRERAETHGLVGMLANTLVLRAEPKAEQTFVALWTETAWTVAQAQAHQDLPFEQLVDALQVPRELSHAPLFQTMLVFNAASAPLTLGPVTATSLPTPRDGAKFDLTLEVTDEEGAWLLEWVYATDLFDAATVARFAQRFERLLHSIARCPEGRIDELALLAPDETGWLLDHWNDTQRARPHAGWVHELIEQQATQTPDAPALHTDGQTLSYRELNARANQLARALRAEGVATDEVVGVCLPRSLEMVVALLGVMKAGAAYLPLDPDYPQDRLDHMARDAGVRLLLSRSGTPRLPQVDGVQVWPLDEAWPRIATHPAAALTVPVHRGNLAYVIYTSGSTGMPKGVGVPHAGLLNRLQWMQEAYRLTPGDRVLQKTPFSFDVSVWEFFWPLMTGASLVVAAPGVHRDSEQLIRTIVDHGVTTLHFVPSMLRAFLDDADAATCHSIRRVICSGEALPFDLQQRCHATLQADLFNLYGPTEASIDVSHWTCRRDATDMVVPIGQPISNTTLHVLDAALQPAPLGVAGELCIGGIGLARAYLGKPALTAEKFVPDPHALTPGARLYRTGDLARWRADGSIEYLGRLDHQVKIRGFRIELGEIEARLLEHPGVAAAAVLAREDRPGDKRLVAYWTAASDPVPDDDTLRQHLAQVLPEHMQPSAWQRLQKLPLSPNGKLDRKQLPAPQAAASHDHVAPRNPAEQTLAEVWQEVLGASRVSVHDNFFRLGGDSILSLQVIARARQRGLRLQPRQMFEHQTVAQQAAIAVQETAAEPTAALAVLPTELPLTPIQHWFFDANFRHPAHWNQAVVLNLHHRLTIGAVEAALRAVVAQHASLRLRFTPDRQQAVAADVDGQWLHQVDLSSLSDDGLAQAMAEHGGRMQRHFDLAQGRLITAALFEAGARRPQRLLIAVHHLAIDGVSWRILLGDLAQACHQALEGRALTLPASTTSYAEWAWRLAHLAQEPQTRAELSYWQATCDTPALFPGLMPGSLAQARRQRLTLDAERSRRLFGGGLSRVRASVEDVLLTALAQALAEWQRRDGLLVELEGHGREDVVDGVDLSRTVGWFTCRYPLKLSVCRGAPIDRLKAVKEQLRNVPRRGIGHGLLRAELAGASAPQVCFNYLGRFDRSFSSGGLFSLADETPGDTRDSNERRTHLIDVDAQVLGEVLTIDWLVDAQLGSADELDRVAQAFLLALQQLADALDHAAPSVTPSDFPLASLDQAALDALVVDWAGVDDLYPLTPMQHGLLVQSELDPGTGTYWLQERYRIDGGIDADAFAAAWQQVIERHPALRTSFVQRPGAPALQAVWRSVPGMVEYQDWRALGADAQTLALDELLQVERAQPDLSRPPLARFRLLRTGECEHLFVLSCHHLLLDAWSFSLLVGDFSAAYRALAQGVHAAAPSVPAVPFSRFVAWLERQDLAGSRAYWQQHLQGFTERTALPLSAATTRGAAQVTDHAMVLSAVDTQALVQAAQTRGLTPNTLVQGAWAWLLSALSGRADVLFGMTVAGRPSELEGAERCVGLFINTLPLRMRVEPGSSVADWLQKLQAEAADARQHQHLPLWEVQAGSPLGAGEPLFDSLLVFENTPVDDSLSTQPLPFRFERVGGRAQTHYPLTLAVSPGSRWRLELSGDPGRIDMARAPALLQAFRTALLTLAEGMMRPLGTLALATEPAVSASVPAVTLPMGVSQVLAQACARWPGRQALVQGGSTLSYAELAQRVEAVAAGLHGLGVQAEARVGLCMGRSLETVVALLGVWRAGAVSVVLDTAWPPQRLAAMAADAGLQVVLTEGSNARLAAGLAPSNATLASLEEQGGEAPAWPHARQLAYLIYTSGSTGTPKAVAVEQGVIAAHAQAMADALGLSPDDRVLQFNTLAFDASLDQLLPPLLRGATVVMRGDDMWDAGELHRQLVDERITVADFPTSYWLQMLREWPAGHGAACGALRQVSVGGEALPADALAVWRHAHFPRAELLNAYGPTEATVTASLQVCDGANGDEAVVPIGRATAGRRLHVLDAWLQPAPEGLIGELYIGGPLLARGYRNQPGLTAESFLPDPFGRLGDRLYRTGDLVCRLADGALAYRGRADQQLKLRGHRIEPGEIEACLRELPGVREAAVLLRDDGRGPRLVAYLTGAAGSTDALWRALAARLPEAMLPSDVVMLAAMPLAPSGKLDRAALPVPAPTSEPTTGAPPSSTVERLIAHVWSTLLKVPAPNLGDHFFRAGGDSILALQLVSRLRREGVTIRPKDVFEHPTLGQLARAARADQAQTIHAVPRGAVPLSPIQHWLLNQPLPSPHHWNQSLLLQLDAALDASAIGRALQALVDHHDALRLVFERDALGAWQQRHLDQLPLHLQHRRAADAASLEAVCGSVQAGLDLSMAPLAAVLIELADGSRRLLLAVHHLVVDGVSWRVLLEDLATACEQVSRHQPLQLPPRSSSYQAWVSGLEAYAASVEARCELAYWQRALPAIPTEPMPALSAGEVRSVEVTLDEATTRQLLTTVHAAYRTEVNDVLLASLGQALGAFTGQSQVLVELEGHGRELLPGMDPSLDLSRSVGWFTSRFPICLAADGDAGSLLVEAKERLRRVPHKGAGWGVLERLAPPDVQAAVRALPQPRISFNYLGQVNEAGEGGGLSLAPERPGVGVAPDNPRSHEIEIDAIVRGGCLLIDWRYSPARHSASQIEALAQQHLAKLCTLVDFALAAPAGATPSDFPLAHLTATDLATLPLARIADIYPLSPMQQGMLFHALCQPADDVYVNQLHCRIEGPLDHPAFEAAWQQAVDRHDMLRTSFWWQRDGEPQQIVWHDARLPLQIHNWQALGPAAFDAALETLLADDRRRGLNLSEAPAMRLQWVHGPAGRCELVWTCHHLLLDGWSSSRLIAEVLARYRAVRQGQPVQASPPRRYRDYIAWLRQADAGAAERHWRLALAGLSAPLQLATALADDGHRRDGLAEQRVELSLADSHALNDAARLAGVTTSSAVQAAWALLLSRYTGRTDVVFGLTVAGRPEALPGCEETIGLFINTLPVLATVDPSQSLGGLAAQVQANHHARVLPFQATPLADIQRWTFGGAQPLFDTLLVFETAPAQATADEGPDDLRLVVADRVDRTSYPLTLNVSAGERLHIELSHDRRMFSTAQARRLTAQLMGLLRHFASPEAVTDLPLITAEEAVQQATWNDTGDGVDVPCDLYALFEAQALRAPDAVAARCGRARLSYRALRERADAAGDALIARGVSTDDVVALHDARGIDLLIMMLAVFRAGAAYLPLDPGHPAQRLRQVLSLSGARWVVHGETAHAGLTEALESLPSVRCTPWGSLRAPAEPVRRPPVHSRSLGYVIYTSGSTGAPKGAMVERRGLMNNLLQKHVQLGLTADDVVAQTAPATFDISVWQFLSALLCGGTVEIVPDEVVRDPRALWSVVGERGVTVLEAVPSLIQALLDEPLPGPVPLRWLLPTGEALPPALANQWLAAHPAVPLLNVYGPAECADDVSLHTIATPLPDDCAHAPVGRPVAHLRLHVMDAGLQPLPVGVAGELCIAGIGVGRGYLGDPARTAEAFVPDPLSPEPGGRMYRTGDIVRQRDDGVLEYLGRRDHQVKLRGHRIELGEIEAMLARQPGVERAVCVLQRGDGGREALVAFVVGDPTLDATALRAALAAALPAYMVPQAIVPLENLPLNANGKVDRRALPAVSAGAAGDSAYTAPASAMEALLANIWGDVLGLSRIGVHDNFFALGGHSLLAVRAMQKTRQLLQREVPLTWLFRAPTIAGMAAELGAGDEPRSPLVTLRSGTRRPLYCVHPAGGHVASYLPLVQALPPGQPILGLQSRRLHDPGWHNASIEAMARDYAAEIRSHQPQGPYQLLGWSMGGTLAMAIAAELEREGGAVDWVGLVDTVHLRDDEAAVRADHATECIDYLEGLLRNDAGRDALQALRQDLANLPADAQLERAVNWARERGLLPMDADVADVRLRLEARHESFRLMRGHRPMPVQAPVHLWHAEQTVRESSEAELSWAPYAPCLTVHPPLPGDHLDIVRAPALAAAVGRLLHKTNAAFAAMEY